MLFNIPSQPINMIEQIYSSGRETMANFCWEKIEVPEFRTSEEVTTASKNKEEVLLRSSNNIVILCEKRVRGRADSAHGKGS